MHHRMFDRQEGSGEVRGENAVPFIEGSQVNRSTRPESGIGNDHCETSCRRCHSTGILDAGFTRDIARRRDDSSASPCNRPQVICDPHQTVDVASSKNDRRTIGDQFSRAPEADTCSPSGDQNRLAGKWERITRVRR